LLLALLLTLSCATKEPQYASSVRVREPELPKCDEPLATLAVKSFSCKAAACFRSLRVYGRTLPPKVVGEGIKDMLVTALVKTGCFKVLEREHLSAVKEERRMRGKSGKLPGAEFVLVGAVTALELDGSGRKATLFAVPVPFAGAVGVKTETGKAHVALDVRLISTEDGSVVLAETVEGKSERWKVGLGGAGLIGRVVSGGWLEGFENTPLEEAVRDLIYRTVWTLVEGVKKTR